MNCSVLYAAGVISDLPNEISVPFGGSAEICAIATNCCSCLFVLVDDNDKEDCILSAYDNFLLVLYNATNITKDHMVKFVLNCNGNYKFSTPIKISIIGRLVLTY